MGYMALFTEFIHRIHISGLVVQWLRTSAVKKNQGCKCCIRLCMVGRAEHLPVFKTQILTATCNRCMYVPSMIWFSYTSPQMVNIVNNESLRSRLRSQWGVTSSASLIRSDCSGGNCTNVPPSNHHPTPSKFQPAPNNNSTTIQINPTPSIHHSSTIQLHPSSNTTQLHPTTFFCCTDPPNTWTTPGTVLSPIYPHNCVLDHHHQLTWAQECRVGPCRAQPGCCLGLLPLLLLQIPLLLILKNPPPSLAHFSSASFVTQSHSLLQYVTL